MHIHRSPHMRGFTSLPNYLLQDRRLSYRARGVLTDLLSRPDGWREDGRLLADSCVEGRGAVAKALRELARAGYYRVEKIRKPDGSIISVAHVYDSPQLPTPGAKKTGSGKSRIGKADGQSKDLGKNPSLPSLPSAEPDASVADETSAAPEPKEVPPEVREAVATLFRVLRPEPRLRLGSTEALALAPLVAEWLELGATEQDLAMALLPGLPQPVHAPAALLRNRLTRKRPPAPVATPQPATPARCPHECGACSAPIPQPGICRACAGLTAPPPALGIAAAVATRGAALARAALRGTLPIGVAAAVRPSSV
ncbi:hypothetical protein [Streptacidiphilus fuscans]|uniref:Helix-turn-helix domain-containing protein n=1 Tax=Streptacidiphilus fuscans TaxID=2789292 RepID=A0A931B7F0_9ACTN|nr:hypothetical protein [Streptacidiphilus fuscans]MBF9070396.1 hypothetical protein [Streptacidiphilus fuscans]